MCYIHPWSVLITLLVLDQLQILTPREGACAVLLASRHGGSTCAATALIYPSTVALSLAHPSADPPPGNEQEIGRRASCSGQPWGPSPPFASQQAPSHRPPAHGRLRPHVFAALAAKHGDGGLMLLRLGQTRALVVSSPRAAEAVLRTQDHVFASRPTNAVVDALLDGGADIAFVPYGEFWRQARRLVTTHLLSARKVHSLRRGREEEARLVMAKIQGAAAAGATVDMTRLLGAFTNDIVCRAVSGKFFREEGRNELFREVIDGNVAAFGGFNLLDYYPGLAKVSMLRRLVFAKTNRLKRKWDDLLDKIIVDHVSQKASPREQHRDRDQQEDEEETDFVDVLLGLQEEYNLTTEHIKAILMDMFVAGTDTSYIVLECAMAELMRKPNLMTKLQAENCSRMQGIRDIASLFRKHVAEKAMPNPNFVEGQTKQPAHILKEMMETGAASTELQWLISTEPHSFGFP
ncbi:hypothetical protein ZWY2020_014224 [Hordeum vulgare]|nr:hypothetical protein ZWY2020_014224 [Hordeum vulgare]